MAFKSNESKVSKVITYMKELNNVEYVDALCKTSEERSNSTMKKFTNFLFRKKLGPGAGNVEQSTALTRPLRVSKPAWEIDLIYRGDLIPTGGLLFIDVEKVNQQTSHKNVAGTVAIVDARRELVFWAIIRQEKVCQFFPKLTGLSKEKISSGITALQARSLLTKVLRGNTVVGAAVLGDLESLDYDHKQNGTQIMDVQHFFKDDKGPFKLLDLAHHFFPAKKDFQCSKHSHARMTAKVAKRMLLLKKEGKLNYSEGIQRTKKSKRMDVGDRCTCGITKKKYKPKPNNIPDWRDFDDFSTPDPYDY